MNRKYVILFFSFVFYFSFSHYYIIFNQKKNEAIYAIILYSSRLIRIRQITCTIFSFFQFRAEFDSAQNHLLQDINLYNL